LTSAITRDLFLRVAEEASTEITRALARAAAAVRVRTDLEPRVALVLGSGLGGLADTLEDRVMIPYGEIDGMPSSAVVGHAGNLVLGHAEGVPVVAMQGRVHLYEGHHPSEVVFGARLVRTLGSDTMIVTNAAGGVDADFTPGDRMGIELDRLLKGFQRTDEIITRLADLTGEIPGQGINFFVLFGRTRLQRFQRQAVIVCRLQAISFGRIFRFCISHAAEECRHGQ